jgi:hypothetical protein
MGRRKNTGGQKEDDMNYWKKATEHGVILHVQKGFEWGNDLLCVPDAEWGTYTPLTDEEHIRNGYMRITREEAEELVAIAGYELPGEEE